MTKKHYITAFILFSCSLLLACGSKNQYVALPGNTSIEILTASYDKEPSNTTEDENGNTFVTYEQCPYLGYKGTSTYCYSDDKLSFSKWEYKDTDIEKCKKLYEKIMEEKNKSYGTGDDVRSNRMYVCNWSTGGKSLVVNCNFEEDKATITLLESLAKEK